MKKWRACAQVNGADYYTSFTIFEFDVPDNLYDKAIALTKSNKELAGTEIYKELVRVAEGSFDFESACREYYEEEPNREYYETEAEYQEALQEYEDDRESYYDEFGIEMIWVEDPGDFIRFKKSLLGRKWEGDQSIDIEYEFGDGFTVTGSFSVELNDAEEIIDVIEAEVEACVGENIKYSSWDEILPDYDAIRDIVEERFADMEEDV